MKEFKVSEISLQYEYIAIDWQSGRTKNSNTSVTISNLTEETLTILLYEKDECTQNHYITKGGSINFESNLEYDIKGFEADKIRVCLFGSTVEEISILGGQ